MKEGNTWLVSNGSRNDIWEDNWLKDEQRKKIISPKPPRSTAVKVQDLMLQDGTSWNLPMLIQMFSEEEVQAIRGIPIRRVSVQDRLVRNLAKNRQYTVNSSYKVTKLCEKKVQGEEGSSRRREDEDRNLWLGIWNMNIKKKIRHFIWRVCHDRIPVNANLRNRGIEVNETRRQCGEGRETVEHLFFHCDTAKLI